MISVRYPFDGSINKVGLFVEVKLGDPTPMMWTRTLSHEVQHLPLVCHL